MDHLVVSRLYYHTDHDSTKMTPMPAPSSRELRAKLLARLDDIRRVLDQTAAATVSSDQHRVESRRLMAALEALEQRVREILAE